MAYRLRTLYDSQNRQAPLPATIPAQRNCVANRTLQNGLKRSETDEEQAVFRFGEVKLAFFDAAIESRPG